MMIKERTFVLIKPDAVQRHLTGEIISRFERVGLRIAGIKFLIPSKDLVRMHYARSEEDMLALGQRSIEGKRKAGIEVNESPKELGQKILDRLTRFISSGPVAAIVLEGNQAVAVTRKLIGSTEPLQSDVGTVRGDYTLDSYLLADMDNRAVRNLVHASSSVAEAEFEVNTWFKKEEIFNYKSVRDKVLYDADLDNINGG